MSIEPGIVVLSVHAHMPAKSHGGDVVLLYYFGRQEGAHQAAGPLYVAAEVEVHSQPVGREYVAEGALGLQLYHTVRAQVQTLKVKQRESAVDVQFKAQVAVARQAVEICAQKWKHHAQVGVRYVALGLEAHGQTGVGSHIAQAKEAVGA